MANELSVTYESMSGIQVAIDAQTVRNQLTKGNGRVTDGEIAMFLRTCQAKKLDPLENGEVFLIKYDDRTPAQLVVGYNAYIRRAESFPSYRGYKAGITVLREVNGVQNIVQKEGSCVYKAIGEKLIGGWCRVYRERVAGNIEESFAEVALDEYSSGKSNWQSKPSTMIRKVAISQAFRTAFPSEYQGLYTSDEMAAAGAIPAKYSVVDEDSHSEETVVEVDPLITAEERRDLILYAQEMIGDKKKGNDVLIKLMVAEGAKSSKEVTRSMADRIKINLLNYKDEDEAEAEEVVEESVTEG